MKLHRTALAAAALAALAAPASAQNEKASIAMPIVSVTFTPVYVALDHGFWSKAGLDVTLHDISGLGSTNAMLAGSVDTAVASGPTLIRGNIRGQKMIGIAQMSNGVAFEIVVTKPAAGGLTMASPVADRIKALKGKKIAVDGPNTIVHAYLKYVARKAGIDPDKEITVSPMQSEASLAAMKGGSLDGATLTSPWPLVAQKQGEVLISSGYSDVPELLPFGQTVTLTRPEFCNQKPTVCEKLGTGYAQAHAFVQDNPKEALAILTKRMSRVEPDILAGAFEQMRKTTPRSPRFSEEGLKNAQDLMVVGGMIKED
jgi:ABC-type nitrate/sulfonate/bicarbonate transport system substrate-binding protein